MADWIVLCPLQWWLPEHTQREDNPEPHTLDHSQSPGLDSALNCQLPPLGGMGKGYTGPSSLSSQLPMNPLLVEINCLTFFQKKEVYRAKGPVVAMVQHQAHTDVPPSLQTAESKPWVRPHVWDCGLLSFCSFSRGGRTTSVFGTPFWSTRSSS